MTTTVQHQGKTWYLAFAWISRDVRRGSDPRERMRLGLHPATALPLTRISIVCLASIWSGRKMSGPT